MMEMINVLSWAFFNSLHLNFLGTCGTFNKTLFNMRTTIHKWGIGEKHNYRRAVLQTLTPWSNWKPPRALMDIRGCRHSGFGRSGFGVRGLDVRGLDVRGSV